MLCPCFPLILIRYHLDNALSLFSTYCLMLSLSQCSVPVFHLFHYVVTWTMLCPCFPLFPLCCHLYNFLSLFSTYFPLLSPWEFYVPVLKLCSSIATLTQPTDKISHISTHMSQAWSTVVIMRNIQCSFPFSYLFSYVVTITILCLYFQILLPHYLPDNALSLFHNYSSMLPPSQGSVPASQLFSYIAILTMFCPISQLSHSPSKN